MKKQCVSRFSVSLNQDLLCLLDRMVKEKGYSNRSLAISDMIRDHLVEHEQVKGDAEAAGTVTVVYDHHEHHVQESLTHLQHDFGGSVVSTLHVHLDHDNCLEVLVLRGRVSEIKKIADRIIGVKGIKHGKFCITTTGKGIPA